MVDSLFGSRIRELRRKLDIKQVDLAKRIGVHTQTLSKYERGEVEPGADALRKIAQSCPVSSAWLLTGEGEMERNIPGVPLDLKSKLDIITRRGDRSQRAIVRGIIDTVFDELD